MRERWKTVPGFSYYKVSDQGRIMSCRYGTGGGVKKGAWRLITPAFGGDKKYLRVDLVREAKKRQSFAVHRLVYQVFVGPIPDGLEIDHIDRNTLNNTPANLRVVTRSQNNANSRARNKTGSPKGLQRTKAGNWAVQTSKDGKSIYLGTYKSKKQAIEVFNSYLARTFGEYACKLPPSGELH